MSVELSKATKRTTLDFPLLVHRLLRSQAALSGRTMTDVLLDAVYEKYPDLQDAATPTEFPIPTSPTLDKES